MNKEKILRISKSLILISIVANAIVLFLFSIALIATKVAENEIILPTTLKVALLWMIFSLFVICFCYYFIIMIIKELYSLKILLTIIIEQVFLVFVFFVDPFNLVPFFFG